MRGKFMKKKIVTLLLCVTMSVSAFACGKSNDASSKKKITDHQQKENDKKSLSQPKKIY